MRPFDKNRDGIVLGEGISAIVIGKKRGDFRLAGGAIEVDNSSITAPTSNSLATVMSRAIEDADISTKDINLVKTHSTASIQNDKKEALALHKIFKEMPNILALKPYIGHTLGASGAVELTILIQFIRDGYIPKTINFKDMDESCNITPTPKEIEAKEGYYLLNYFGFGGNNSSLVLEYRRI
jgi:3-oxoacyl-[acyl-carrier-protein] synthase-1